ncbi:MULTISPECIES: LysR substrate-binding domain-containing protein [Dyella]|uniref:LysR family transcriptional regulator n=2 Tax=Dyella TaxID=231454 RepID=A0A4R0YYN3_9GAMM|nr:MULTISPECIES: LysR substrate-binding domain-containing protein [Dyella]TBR39996.1 LysR family transcriptional regulator [Dyella terrae]TCI12424.1 LysR family transcriptional regulator [Dyella soli]
MDLRSLRYFLEVVRHGGFARASAHAHASQPTLSKAVAQLEDDLGAQLMERDRQGVRLTAAGEVVQRHAVIMLAEAARLRDELDALKGLRRGELRLGLPPLGSSVLFAPLLARYRQLHPQIDIRLMEHGSRRLEQAVLAGELDVAATLEPVGNGLDFQSVRDEPMVALLPATHPRATARRFRLEWLAELPLIFYEEGFALNRLIRDVLARKNIVPHEAVRSAQLDFILALVSAGSGVALVPQLTLAQRTLEGIAAIPLAGKDLRWKMVLAWSRGRVPSPAARAWLDLVAQTHPDL